MRYRLVRELAADGVVVAVACRVLAVSTAGYYEWEERAPSARAVADQALSEQIVEIHAMSRGSYGAPWVHAELRLRAGRPLRSQAGGTANAERRTAWNLPAARETRSTAAR